MNYEKNIKYFKSNDKHFYTGVILAALGVICFICPYVGLYFLPYHEFTSLAIAAIGAAVAFIPCSFRASESELDGIIEEKTKKYAEETAENAGISHMLSRKIRPCTLGGYVFEGENVLVRRGKDDRHYRSSLYTATALVFTNDGIYASQKTFSLIEDSESESDAEFFYDELENAFVSEEEATLADGAKAKTCFVVFTCGGKEIFRAPAKSSYALTALCDDINHEIAEIKRKNAK